MIEHTEGRLLTDKQLALIDHPIVQSLLYEINLLPEQLLALKYGPGHKNWGYMLAVCGHFDMMFKERAELIEALRDMLKVQEALMPGIRYIAVQDYALINNAPVTAHRLLTKHAPKP